MSHFITVKTHPFRFVLYLEWALLAVILASEVFPSPFLPSYGATRWAFLFIVGFAVMGLRLPKGNAIDKVLFTGAEIGLILLATLIGSIRTSPFLYLILVIRSCLIFERYGYWIVTGLALSLFSASLSYRIPKIDAETLLFIWDDLYPFFQKQVRFFLLSFALLFALTLVFVLMLMKTMLAERRSREELAIAHDRLRRYALRIEDQATLQERNRIAREIHDSLGHSLTALNLQLEGALRLWQSNPDKSAIFLAEAKRLGSMALHDVRQSVSTLRADPMKGNSLETAIEALIQDFQNSTGIVPNCAIALSSPLPMEIKTTIYRIVQEALTNISKYAAATEVTIELRTTPSTVSLLVRDNGRGFDVRENTTGFGLQGMRERSLDLGGQLNIISQPGSGCQVKVNLPL